MMLTAYAQANRAKLIQLWVGMFGTEQPPSPRFFIDQTEMRPTGSVNMLPIRDRQTGASGKPVNHQNVFQFQMPDAGQPHLIRVEAGGEHYEFTTHTLPESVPQTLDGSFNLLLCSCYYQPEDINGLLATIVSQIKVKPHLTVMAGDQVYLDLPLFEDLPEKEPALSRMLGQKYMRNWASTGLNVPGLQEVLARAPVVSIPDDHEFWNNFPFKQKQLPNTWDDDVRGHWRTAARSLYEDYQIGGVPTQRGAVRIDVEPLKMLFVDMRCDRDELFNNLMSPQARASFDQWVADLLAAYETDQRCIGVLCSGQALFIDAPQDERKKRDIDAEMGNYKESEVVQQQLSRLADKGIPVLYLTGDVHWSRIASALDISKDRTLLYEVICSPSRLIRTPFLDSAKEAKNKLKGIFGKQDRWPRHSDPDPVPDRFGPNRRFALTSEFQQRGDQVAVVSFTRAGNGVDFQATYYAIHPDKSISQTNTYPLRIVQ